jgi:hypothetical protein
MNTISQGFQKEAEEIILKNVVGNKDIKAIVFISSKSDNFIAGADIDMVSLLCAPLPLFSSPHSPLSLSFPPPGSLFPLPSLRSNPSKTNLSSKPSQ